MKVIKIPEYTGIKYKHVATSWYILKTPDKTNLKDRYYAKIKSRSNKTTLRITQAFPKFDTAYIYVIMYLNNGSTIDFPLKAISYDDINTVYEYDRDVAVNMPEILGYSDNLPDGGNLTITLGRISPDIHKLKDAVIYIEDERGIPVCFKMFNSNRIRVYRGEIENYNPSEVYKAYIWHRTDDYFLSPPNTLFLNPNAGGLKLLSNTVNVDSSRYYDIVFDRDVTVENVEVYLESKKIGSYTGNRIFGDDSLLPNKCYTLYISLQDGDKSYTYVTYIYTVVSGSLYDKDPFYTLKDTAMAESMAITPINTYTEKTQYGRILLFSEDRVKSIKSYGLIEEDTGPSKIYCDITKDVYVREISELEVSVVHHDHGVKKVSILLLDRNGMVNSLIASYNLPDHSAKIPAVISSTENKNGYQIFTAINDSGTYKIVDLITGELYGVLSEVYDVKTLMFTYMGGEELVIAGNMRAIYRMDYNMKVLDNITYMPAKYRNADIIPSRLLNGNAVYFIRNSNDILEIDPNTGKHVDHKFLYLIKKVTRHRDGSFTILTKDDPNPPSITDIYRYG